MPSLKDLPPELALLIGHKLPRSTLCNMARVSKQMRRHYTEPLYTNVHIYNEISAMMLCVSAAEALLTGRNMLQHTRNVELCYSRSIPTYPLELELAYQRIFRVPNKVDAVIRQHGSAQAPSLIKTSPGKTAWLNALSNPKETVTGMYAFIVVLARLSGPSLESLKRTGMPDDDNNHFFTLLSMVTDLPQARTLKGLRSLNLLCDVRDLPLGSNNMLLDSSLQELRYTGRPTLFKVLPSTSVLPLRYIYLWEANQAFQTMIRLLERVSLPLLEELTIQDTWWSGSVDYDRLMELIGTKATRITNLSLRVCLTPWLSEHYGKMARMIHLPSSLRDIAYLDVSETFAVETYSQYFVELCTFLSRLPESLETISVRMSGLVEVTKIILLLSGSPSHVERLAEAVGRNHPKSLNFFISRSCPPPSETWRSELVKKNTGDLFRAFKKNKIQWRVWFDGPDGLEPLIPSP